MHPHEETWSQGRIHKSAVDCGVDENDCGQFFGRTEVAEPRAALAAAAPDMARALLAFHRSITYEDRTAARELTRLALIKAGVQLP